MLAIIYATILIILILIISYLCSILYTRPSNPQSDVIFSALDNQQRKTREIILELEKNITKIEKEADGCSEIVASLKTILIKFTETVDKLVAIGQKLDKECDRLKQETAIYETNSKSLTQIVEQLQSKQNTFQ